MRQHGATPNAALASASGSKRGREAFAYAEFAKKRFRYMSAAERAFFVLWLLKPRQGQAAAPPRAARPLTRFQARQVKRKPAA